MSICKKIDSLDADVRRRICKELVFQKKGKNKKFAKRPEEIEAFAVEDPYVYIPLAYAVSLGILRRERVEFPEMACAFTGELWDMQKEVRKESVAHLNQTGSCIIALRVGGGKTITAINIACKIRLKTLVLAHRIILFKQWVKAITECSTASVQVLEAGDDPDLTNDFFIINPMNVTKFPRGAFEAMGTVICDEAHLIMTSVMSRSLLHLSPRYCIGLSATPMRLDGMDSLLDAYFGKAKVYRKLDKPHIVYRVSTHFTPEYETTANGTIDWNTVLVSQAECVERNELVIALSRCFARNVIMILCKRVSQVRYIYGRLVELDISADWLYGNKQHYDEGVRVLVATTSKAGCGFDAPERNMLILAADVHDYFLQILGRVMRTPETPMIFDLVDNNNVLRTHFTARKTVYLEHGGVVRDFNKEYAACIVKSQPIRIKSEI
jgi:superfamily II DNA or RNA helicase